MMKKGDKLLQAVLETKADFDSDRYGKLSNLLLAEFHRGYPLEKLYKLLHSEIENHIQTGVWIVDELGQNGRPFLKEITGFLSHKNHFIRSYAIESILTCATETDRKANAEAVLLLEDNHVGVRWQACHFIFRADPGQLSSALDFLECNANSEKYINHIQGLRLLLSKDMVEVSKGALNFLRSDVPVLRKYGAIIALRIAGKDLEPLRFALNSDDEEVKDFTLSVNKIEDFANVKS